MWEDQADERSGIAACILVSFILFYKLNCWTIFAMTAKERCMECFQTVFGPCLNGRLFKSNGHGKENADKDVVISNPVVVDISLRQQPPVPQEQPGYVYLALYDYTARTEDDISFNAGDKLEALDKSSGEWWYARALTGVSANKKGYIPANYVAAVESLDAEP